MPFSHSRLAAGHDTGVFSGLLPLKTLPVSLPQSRPFPPPRRRADKKGLFFRQFGAGIHPAPEKNIPAPLCRMGRTFFSLVCAALAALALETAHAAMPAGTGNEIAPRALSGQMPEQTRPTADKDAAASEISGSPWPGVIDHLLQRPLPGEENTGADIHINYPSIGNKDIDADIREWVSGIADAFASHLDFAGAALESVSSLDETLAHLSQNEPPQPESGARHTFGLWGSYNVSRPSDAAVSIVFELWNYTGGEHGNLDIITLNYSLLTGQRLGIVDLFEKSDLALELMSSWSRKALDSRLGHGRRSRMLQDGTEPLVENFSSLTLTPEGICINFQPYQVAPWDAGVQKVNMPLEELLPSEPLLALWGK